MATEIAPKLVWEINPSEIVGKIGVGCDRNPLDENSWYWVARSSDGTRWIYGYGSITRHPMYIFLTHVEFIKYLEKVIRCQ